MSSDYIRKNIVVCNGGDTTSNAIKIYQFLKVFNIFKSVMVTYGWLILLMPQLAYILSGQVNHRPCSFVFQGMSHSVS
jgi:hypothetical protein